MMSEAIDEDVKKLYGIGVDKILHHSNVFDLRTRASVSAFRQSVERAKKAGKTVGYKGGYYDGLHANHIATIWYARLILARNHVEQAGGSWSRLTTREQIQAAENDVFLIVAASSDMRAALMKGVKAQQVRPLMPWEYRAFSIASASILLPKRSSSPLVLVDAVCRNAQKDSREEQGHYDVTDILPLVQPDYLFEHAGGLMTPEFIADIDYEGELVVVPEVDIEPGAYFGESYSTTAIIDRVSVMNTRDPSS